MSAAPPAGPLVVTRLGALPAAADVPVVAASLTPAAEGMLFSATLPAT